MAPDTRRWLEQEVKRLSEAAALIRRIAATRRSALARAEGLDHVVAHMQRRLDAAGPPPPAVSSHFAGSAPRAHRSYPSIEVNTGPIMRAVHAAWGGEAFVAPAPPALLPPPPEPVPFTAGPQLGLFA